jgi:hypothetical protein
MTVLILPYPAVQGCLFPLNKKTHCSHLLVLEPKGLKPTTGLEGCTSIGHTYFPNTVN